MKIKFTLLFTHFHKAINMMDLEHIQVFLNDDLEFPSCYLTTKEPAEALSQICYDNFRFDPSWLYCEISDFRKTQYTEYEAVYSSSRPAIPNSNKQGKFYNMQQLLSLDKKIGPYYEQLLRSKNFLIH
jgi:hypothetical protein